MIDNSLWQGLLALYDLLVEKKSNREGDYQILLENHPILFSALGVTSPQSFEKRSRNKLPYDEERQFTPEPDFICLNDMSNALVIVELKTPFVGKITTTRSDGNRAKLTANAETYVSQCSEYSRSIQDNRETREYLCLLFDIDKISEVRAKLLYSLSENNDLPLIESLCSQRTPRVEIVTYDTFYYKLCEQHSQSSEIPHGQPGLSCIYHLSIDAHQVNDTSVLTMVTGNNGDQLVAKYCSGTLSFSLINGNGERRALSGSIDSGVNSYVKLEYAHSEAGSYFSLTINDAVTEKHISSASMPFSLANPAVVLGADRFGSNGICCRFHVYYILSEVMGISDSLGSYHYYKRNKGNPCAIVFDGSAFLYTEGNSKNLIQDDPRYQPRYHNPAQQDGEPDAASRAR